MRFLVAGFVCTIAGVPLVNMVPIILFPIFYSGAMGWAIWGLEIPLTSRIGFTAACFLQFYGWVWTMAIAQGLHGTDPKRFDSGTVGLFAIVSLVTNGLGLLSLLVFRRRSYFRAVLCAALGGVVACLLLWLGAIPAYQWLGPIVHPLGGLPVCLPSMCAGISIAWFHDSDQKRDRMR